MDERVASQRLTSAALAGIGIATLYAFLATVSWRRSGDLLVDWGRELYTAWRLSDGGVLYRDVASMFGPLSAYVNATAFRFLGVSAGVLQATNLVIIAIIGLLLHLVFRRISGPRAGIVAVLLFLVVFAFGHATEAGIYNFVTPYSHEATHGILLCTALVWLLMRAADRPTAGRGILAGLAGGLAFLTKPEIGLGALAVLGCGGILLARHSPPRSRPGLLVGLVTGLLLPSIVAVVGFAGPLGTRAALRVPTAGFEAASAARAWDLPFYQAVSGLDRAGRNLIVMIAEALALGLLLWLFRRGERRLSERTASRVGLAVLTAGAVLVSFVLLRASEVNLLRPLPLVALAAAATGVRAAWSETDAQRTASRLGMACWSVLSVALVGKIFLNAQTGHFGFFLALPAMTLVTVVALYHVPRHLPPLTSQLVVGLTILFLGALGADSLGKAVRQYRGRSLAVGPASDALHVFPPSIDPRGYTVAAAYEYLSANLDGVSTVSVLPEGALLNFWLRRPAPTKHISLMPPEVAAFGEHRVTRQLLSRPADRIVLSDRSLADYGTDSFAFTEPGRTLIAEAHRSYCTILRLELRAVDAPGGDPQRKVAHPFHRIEILAPRGEPACEGRPVPPLP